MIGKNKLLFLTCAAVIIAIIFFIGYLAFFYESKSLEPVSQSPVAPKPVLLDSRFLTVYGKITGMGSNYVDLHIVNSSSTDYVFSNVKDISVVVGASTIIKKYSETADTYMDIKLSDIKINNMASVYIKDDPSAIHFEAIGIKVLNNF